MNNVIGDNIRKHRLALGLTQEQLAAKAGGRSVNQINGYERGRSRPSPAILSILAHALGVTTSELTADDNVTAAASASIGQLIAELRATVAVANKMPVSAIKVTLEIVG